MSVVDKSSVLADTIHGQIAISSFEKDIIATTLFNRLHGIHQNSTAYMTFPANRTKRVEHSFGTMYLCGKIFCNSVRNASSEDSLIFFQKAEEEISDIVSQIKESEEYTHKFGMLVKKVQTRYDKLDIRGGIYDQVIPGNLESDRRRSFLILFEAIRIAALLHDVGHPPFSHITEFALAKVYQRVQAEKLENETVTEFNSIMKNFCENKQELHEEMGNAIAEILLKDVVGYISEEQAKDDGTYDRQLFRLVAGKMALAVLKEIDDFSKALHSIIAGTLDGDRLDYVCRDAVNSGFSVGIIEYERLISSMKLVSTVVNEKPCFAFCPCTSAINTIEDFLIRRWNLYCNIIYHHHVVKTDYLLQKSIEEIAYAYLKNDAGKTSKESDEKAFLKSDDYNYILPYDISGLWKAIQHQSSSLEWGYSISQWDDAWLTVVLKKVYFEKFIKETSSLNKMLTELLTNKRRFVSLIKRKEEFGVIDRAVAAGIVTGKDEIEKAVAALQSKKADVGVDIQGFLMNIDRMFDKSENYVGNENSTGLDGFLLVFINKILSYRSDRNILQDIVDGVIAKKYGEKCFAVFKAPKTGTKKDLHIYRKYYNEADEQLVYLNDISNIEKILENNLSFTPFFFLYMDIEETVSESFDFTKERAKIGSWIAEGICTHVIDFLNKKTIETSAEK